MLLSERNGWGQDSPAFRQVFTSLFIPRGTREQTDWFNDMMKAAASPQNAARLHEAFGKVDVMDLLGEVRTPTLVVHARQDAVVPFEEGRLLAASIPGARFLPLDSSNHVLIASEPAWPHFLREFDRFLSTSSAAALPGRSGEVRAGAPPRSPRAAMVSTDLHNRALLTGDGLTESAEVDLLSRRAVLGRRASLPLTGTVSHVLLALRSGVGRRAIAFAIFAIK